MYASTCNDFDGKGIVSAGSLPYIKFAKQDHHIITHNKEIESSGVRTIRKY